MEQLKVSKLIMDMQEKTGRLTMDMREKLFRSRQQIWVVLGFVGGDDCLDYDNWMVLSYTDKNKAECHRKKLDDLVKKIHAEVSKREKKWDSLYQKYRCGEGPINEGAYIKENPMPTVDPVLFEELKELDKIYYDKNKKADTVNSWDLPYGYILQKVDLYE